MTKIIQIMHPNTDMGAIATDYRLCDAKYAFNDDGKDARALEFEAQLSSLNGVKKAEMNKHEIHLERYEAYEWEYLFTVITPLVISYMNDGVVISVDDRRGERRSVQDDFDPMD